MNNEQDIFKHPDPHAEEKFQTRPHLFNKEQVVTLKGHLPSVEGAETLPAIQEIIEEFKDKPEYDATDLDLLHYLDLNPIKGLPLQGTNTYVETYAIMTRDDLGQTNVNSKVNAKTAVAYPMSGKAVSFNEGIIYDNNGTKEVFTTHDVKNVGITHSAGESYAIEQRAKDFPIGKERISDVFFAIKAEKKLRSVGILTNKLLPPVILDQNWFRNTLIEKEESKFTQITQLNRAWASNVRINGLYPTNVASSFEHEDIDRMIVNKKLTVDIMRGRIEGFLQDLKNVREFNIKNNTKYKLGFSDKFENKEINIETYCVAFRSQIVTNLALMVENDVWHGNLSPHNISIAGEVGDQDEVVYAEKDTLIFSMGKETVTPDQMAEYRKTMALNLLERMYVAQGIITGVLGKEENFYTPKQMWLDVQNEMSADCWAKNISYEDLLETNPHHSLNYGSNQAIMQRLFTEFKA